MARYRKTVKVDWLKQRVNRMLAESTCAPEVRDGMCAVLNAVLHETDNYKGFGYLQLNMEAHPRWVAHLKAPQDATPEWTAEYERLTKETFGDQSRKVYY